MGKQSSDQLLRELARVVTLFDLTHNHDKHGEETIEAAVALSDVAEQLLVLIVGHAKLNKWFNKDEKKFFEWCRMTAGVPTYGTQIGDK